MGATELGIGLQKKPYKVRFVAYCFLQNPVISCHNDINSEKRNSQMK